jgi:AraC-like DNA-binding protein
MMNAGTHQLGQDRAVLEHEPGAALRPFVARYLFVEYSAGHHDLHLPGPGVVLAIRLRGECRLYGNLTAPDVAFTGLWHSARRHEHGLGHTAAIVQFTPAGAAMVLRQPIDALADRTVAGADVLGSSVRLPDLHEQLVAAADPSRRARLLDRFLTDRIAGAQLDPLISEAVDWLERECGAGRIDALVRHIGLSERALERRFRRTVGTSPRKFASLLRLQRATRLGQAGVDFTTIAHAAGYCDQSHFNKDFRRFAGMAPSAYFGRKTD